MKRLGYILFALLLQYAPVQAQEQEDTAYQHMRKEYLNYYNNPHENQKFYEYSEKMKAYYIKHNNLDSYYKVKINEALYDTEHGNTYRAVKKANDILDEMKKDGIKQYDVVYTVLGTIFDTRGSFRMSEKYYMSALASANPDDKGTLISIYSRLADLKSTRQPKEAWEWNEKFGALAIDIPEYYKVYLVLKGRICFFLNDHRLFDQAYEQLQNHLKNYPHINHYGVTSMEMMKAVFDKHYERALHIINIDTILNDNINQYDTRIKAYEMMGRSDLALKEVNKRRDVRDSLNSDMMFNNINEINAEMGIAKLNEKATKEREMWLAVVIILLVSALGLVISRSLMRRKMEKKLRQQNKELEVALSRAEESDRMKTSFIEHVSHEIRTPLNVITGYAQIVSNPDYTLNQELRDKMLSEINHNTMEITDIVNELLEVAQDESKEYYVKEDTIAVNELAKQLLASAEKKNQGRLELRFRTDLSDDYTFKCNRAAVIKAINPVLNNALKFTDKGSVELYVHESPDHGVVRFIITDTGIGISKEYRKHIFERFFKVDPFKQGFGLGLTVSQKIAQLLGGSLELDNSYEQGARFIFTLPT